MAVMDMEKVWLSLNDTGAIPPSADEILKEIVECLVGDIAKPAPIVAQDGSITLHPKMFISATGFLKLASYSYF